MNENIRRLFFGKGVPEMIRLSEVKRMSIFNSVKDAVTTRQAAEYYGIKVNRSGMCRCPFHDDRTPSMKVDQRFHCFGCGADGDVVNFVAKLFDLQNKEAAEKLAADFDIRYDKWKPPNRKTRHEKRKQELRARRFEETDRLFYAGLTDYFHTLLRWKEEYAPKSPDEEWDDRFVEALQNLLQIEYVIDCYLEANVEEKIDIMNDYGGKILEHKRRIEERAAGEAGETGRNHGSLRTSTDR